MRGTPIVYLISLAAALTLLTGSAVSAQLDEPIATAPPPQYEDLSMAIIENDLTQPAINTAVSETATFAFTEIGGTTEGPKAEDKKAEGKKAGLDSVSLPSTEKVVLAARDAGEKGYDLVVISGGDSQGTVGFAQAYPETFFFDIDQPLPCVTGDGRADPSGTCEGGVGALPFNYVAVDFDTDQAAYLAGVIAASASRDDILGIISGTADCPDCNRTIEGFVLGARSVKPDIEVHQAYLADEGEAVAFGDPTSAKTFAKAFIDVYQPDVILPLTGSGSRGVIEAACEAGHPGRGDRRRCLRDAPGAGGVHPHQHHQGLRVRGPRVDLRLGQRRGCVRGAAGAGRRPRGRDRRVDATGEPAGGPRRALRAGRAGRHHRPGRDVSRGLRGARPAQPPARDRRTGRGAIAGSGGLSRAAARSPSSRAVARATG